MESQNPHTPEELAQSPESTMYPWQLTDADLGWLSIFNNDPDSMKSLLPQLQDLARIGSIPLVAIRDPEARTLAFEAREQFLLAIGLSHTTLDSVKNAANQRAYLGLTSTFIEAQRYLLEKGINPAKAIIQAPRTLLNMSTQSWEEHLSDAEGYGIRKIPGYVHQLNAMISTQNSDSPESVIKLEEKFGISLKKMIARQPTIALIKSDALVSRLEAIAALGLDSKIVNQQPSFLTASIENTQLKIDFFNSIGLNGVALINRAPVIGTLSVENLKTKVETLNQFGFNNALIARWPKVLTASVDSLREKYQKYTSIVQKTGWEGDLNELIYEAPGLLSYAGHRIDFLGSVACYGTHSSRRSMGINEVKSKLYIPAEYLVLALDHEAYDPKRNTKNDIVNIAKSISNNRRLAGTELRGEALEVAEKYSTGAKGRIASAYIELMRS